MMVCEHSMTYKLLLTLTAAGVLLAQSSAPTAQPGVESENSSAKAPAYVVETGTKIPLSLINSISTKSAAEGDRVYLETSFPIMSNGRIVIPVGSYVAGTVTQVKRPGRVKGRGELYLRFDSLTLPNGVTRDFRARLGSLDGTSKETLDRSEGRVKGDSDKSGDARVVGETAGWGTLAGGVAGRSGMGAGIGAAAGAAAGLVGVLLTRGPEAVLERGTTMEMVLDRNIQFTDQELDFSSALPARRQGNALAPAAQSERQTLPARRRFPY